MFSVRCDVFSYNVDVCILHCTVCSVQCIAYNVHMQCVTCSVKISLFNSSDKSPFREKHHAAIFTLGLTCYCRNSSDLPQIPDKHKKNGINVKSAERLCTTTLA